MIKEALESLGKTFQAAASARVLNIPGNDGRKCYVDQNGTLTVYDVPPPLRAHHVNSVDDLIAAARKWNTGPVVWISGEAIVLVPDDADRRDRITLKLVKSAAFAKLCSLASEPELNQAELVRLLRVDLVGAVNRVGLLAAVRQIRFRQSTAGESTIQHGNESLGRTIESQVSGASEIPETVLVSCSVFSNPGEREKRLTIACDLEIITAESAFRFHPLPDELERVKDEALADIRETIGEALGNVAVFFGSP